jgi:hypothetical protein
MQPTVGYSLLVTRGYLITQNKEPQSLELLVDEWSALRGDTQHTQQTNIHAPGGIRIYDRSRRTAVKALLWNKIYLYVFKI